MTLDLVKRTKGENNDQSPTMELWKSYNAGTPIKYNTYQGMMRKACWSMNGYDIPNFHARKRNGELLPMTPFRSFRSYGAVASGVYDVYHHLVGGYDWHNWSVPTLYTPSIAPLTWYLTEEDLLGYCPEPDFGFTLEAAARIYSKGHDTLTFLAELADVKRTFIQAGKTLLKMSTVPWKLVKLNKVTSEWMAIRYGWRPFLYDIQELIKAVESLKNGRTRYSERAGITHTSSNSEEAVVDVGHGVRRHTYSDTIVIGLRGSVTADVDIPAFQVNPLQTGWELIPFSFVIDWFFSVGKAIAGWSFLSLRPNYVASAGFSVLVNRSYYFSMDYYYTNYWGTNYGSAECEAEIQVRVPCRIPLLPHSAMRLDGLKIVDLMAMAVQHLHRR